MGSLSKTHKALWSSLTQLFLGILHSNRMCVKYSVLCKRCSLPSLQPWTVFFSYVHVQNQPHVELVPVSLRATALTAVSLCGCAPFLPIGGKVALLNSLFIYLVLTISKLISYIKYSLSKTHTCEIGIICIVAWYVCMYVWSRVYIH